MNHRRSIKPERLTVPIALTGALIMCSLVAALSTPTIADIAASESSIVTTHGDTIEWRTITGDPVGSVTADALWTGAGPDDTIGEPRVVWNPIAHSFYAAATSRRSPAGDDHIGDEDILTALTPTGDPSDGWAAQRNSYRSLGFNAERLSLGAKGDGIYFTIDFDPLSPIAGCWMGVADRALLTNGDRIRHYTQLSNTPRGFRVDESSRVNPTELLSATLNSGGFAYALLTGWNTTSPDGMLVYSWPEIPWGFPSGAHPTDFTAVKSAGGHLWAVDTVLVGSAPGVRWFDFDLRGWPDSGSAPALAKHGDITNAVAGDIAIDDAGDVVIVFESGTGVAYSLRRGGDDVFKPAVALSESGSAPRIAEIPGGGFAVQWIDGDASFVSVLRTAPAPPVQMDLNQDGAIDAADLGALIAGFGTTGPGDLNGDGIVDTADLAALIGAMRQ